MKRYAEYKDSGLEWIGKIPQCWYVGKLKHYTKVKDGTHDTPDYVDENESNYPLVTSKDIKDGSIYFDDVKYISYMDYIKINSRSDVEKYNVIMPMIGTVGNPAIVLSDRAFSIKNVALFKTDNIIKAKYLKYLLGSDIVKLQFDLINRGGVQQFVSLDILKNIYIIMNNNIDRIVEYLDQKTSAIDTLISDKQKLIDLLKEKRQAVISEAVTKGLEKTVKMKDSGIEWIGEIPKRWEVCKLKHIFADGKDGIKIGPFGSALKGKTLSEGTYKIYNQAHLIQNDFSIDRHFISEDTFNELSNYEVHPGDILFSMMGTIGKCRIMPIGFPLGIMDSHLLKAKLNDRCLPEYFEYIYDKNNSNIIIEQLLYYSNGSIMNGLNSSIIKNVYLPLPDIKTQQIIIRYLNTKIASIDTLLADITNQIEKLKEYRQGIISEAVTGKVAI